MKHQQKQKDTNQSRKTSKATAGVRGFSHEEHFPGNDHGTVFLCSTFRLQFCFPKRSRPKQNYRSDDTAALWKAGRDTREQWNLTLLGRKLLLKTSGSHSGRKKALLRQETTYLEYGLSPPHILTNHARVRLQERGAGSIPRFVAGTRQTLVATFVPNSKGRERFRRYQNMKLACHRRLCQRIAKENECYSRMQLKKKTVERQRLHRHIRRNRSRINRAARKREVHALVPISQPKRLPYSFLKKKKKKKARKIKQSKSHVGGEVQGGKAVTILYSQLRKKPSAKLKNKIHLLVDAHLTGKSASSVASSQRVATGAGGQPEWVRNKNDGNGSFRLELL